MNKTSVLCVIGKQQPSGSGGTYNLIIISIVRKKGSFFPTDRLCSVRDRQTDTCCARAVRQLCSCSNIIRLYIRIVSTALIALRHVGRLIILFTWTFILFECYSIIQF